MEHSSDQIMAVMLDAYEENVGTKVTTDKLEVFAFMANAVYEFLLDKPEQV